MGVEALVADANGGIYMVASMAESLDQTLASLEHLQTTLDAKMKEIEELNGMIASLKKENADALAAKDAEIANAKEAAQVEADDALKAENETLKNDLDASKKENEDLKAQLAAKDEEITALKKDLAEKDQIIADKDAEINELSQTAQEAPAPAKAPESNNTGAKKEEGFKVESIVKEGMTLSEREKAYNERMEMLRKARF